MTTRKFRCAACGHTFDVPYGTGGAGADMACPNCGARLVHRAEEDRGYARGGAGRGPAPTVEAEAERGAARAGSR